MPTPTVWITFAALSVASAVVSAQPADPERGRSLWARTNDAPLSCGQDGSCHGPDPSVNQYRVLRGADNAALILRAIGSARTGMGFLAPHVDERDAIDIAAFLGVVSRERLSPPASATDTGGTGGDAGAGGGPNGGGPTVDAPPADAASQAAAQDSIAPPFNVGYGGCSLGLPGPADPLLPGLAASAAIVLALRAARRRRAVLPTGRSDSQCCSHASRPTWRQSAAAAAVVAAALLTTPAGALAVAPGDAAPAFALPALDGGTVSLEAERGRVVWLDFWASWCAPCRQSFPWMSTMQRRHRERGLRVIAVSVDTRHADVQRFVGREQPAFAIALDPTGAIAARYAVRAMPSSVLIDTDGRVLAVHAGFRASEADGLERRIEQALDMSMRPVDTGPAR
jgi:peroxiredoxin